MNKFLKSVVAVCVVCCLGAVAPVNAAQRDRDNQVKSLDPYAAAKLNNAQKEMKNENYAEALADLKDLVDDVQDKPYALALTQQMIAYVYLDQKKYRQALPYMRKAVELHALPDQQQHNMLLTLAQLYAMQDEYREAIDLLEDWFRTEKNPPATAYVLAATSYYNLKELKQARKFIKLAIKEGNEPNEQWYGLLVGVDYELKNYDEMIDTLRTMISYWPDEADYWRQLYGMYLMQEKNDKALVVMRLAYEKGMIDDEGDLLNLARLEMLNGMPFPAAKVLSEGIKSGKIESNLENLQLLVSAWTQAQETDQALETLDKAAKLADDGKLYLRKAQLCYGQAEWKCTIKAAEQAAAKGGLDEPGNAYLMKGMALTQVEQYDQAKEAFHKAERYDSTRKQAKGWIKYVQTTEAATS